MAIGNGYQTGSANPGFYQNQLQSLISNPGSFQGTPGYGFAFDQAMKGVNAQNSTIRGSGNALTALQDRAAGLASQNYGDYLKTLGGLSGQEQQYDLGLGGLNNTAQGNANTLALGNAQNQNTANRNANDFSLGQQQNANTATRNANDYSIGNARNANDLTLGMGQNANTAQRNANDFGLGMYSANNNYSLGQQQNANTAQNNWWNYSLGNQQNQNQYNLGMYNAETNRGSAQSNAYNNGQNTLLDWTKFGYQLNPGQRLAGVPGTSGGGWNGVG